jgi:glycosyltransferase involved in cell wall biosynthesis
VKRQASELGQEGCVPVLLDGLTVAADDRELAVSSTRAKWTRSEAALPMRVLIAIGVPRQQEAGAAGVVLNHAKELEKRGHTVDCWFLDDLLPEPVRFRRFEAVLFGLSVANRILQDKNKYDVVNLHAPWGCAYGLRRRLGRSAVSPPYVLTMQGSEERYAHMMRLENNKGRAAHFKWQNRLWHRLYHQTMYDLSVRTADYGVVANREGWLYAELKHGLVPGRISFVPNGVEHMFFARRTYPEQIRPRLLYVGTWLDRKGTYYLARAFEIVARRSPSASLTVVGCGDAEQHVKNSFPKEIRNRVCVQPFIKRGDMPVVYAEHDIFVFPSLVEGMPLTLLEAMAAAMPVVTTNTSGMADVVEDGFNGLLVPPAEANALAEATARIVESVDLRKQLGEAAQATMRRYTWDTVIEKIEAVLRAAVNKAGAPLRQQR